MNRQVQNPGHNGVVTAAPEGLDALTAKGRATRERIVEAAAQLIFERDARSVTLDDVLSATGTSKSQLYHYFDDRDDLVHAVIDRQRERILERHGEILATAASFEDLERWRDMVVSSQAARDCRFGCPLGSLATELSESDEVARVQLSRAFSEWEGLIARALAAMVAEGALHQDVDVVALAVGVVASLQGGLLLAEVERSARPLAAALDSSIAYLRTLAR